MQHIPRTLKASIWLAATSLLPLGAQAALTNSENLLPTFAVEQNTVTRDEHPLWQQINAFLSQELEVPQSGITKDDYLRIINGQIMGMLKYQGEDGSIQNPLTGADRNYATPHFAHCAIVLITSGYNQSPELYEAAIKAMTYSLKKLRGGLHPAQLARRDGEISTKEFQKVVQQYRENPDKYPHVWGAGDFFPLPLMKAMPLFKKEYEAGRIPEKLFTDWENDVRAINPEIAYNWYLTPDSKRWSSNWAVKNGTGEWLRENLGYSDLDYAKNVLSRHYNNFTPYGMFREGAYCYDLFPRTAMVTILAEGYDGDYADELRDHMWRGAWTSLFIQSPNGEMPPGFRSAAHIWNETMQVELFEYYASAYAAAGEMRLAGIFKRAAHLSFQSITEWIRPDGTGYIVKNRYPIEKQHAYEAYSTHTNYNMLAMSQLATAWQAAQDGIQEYACPSEVGGFVVDLESDHRNNSTIFPWMVANVRGNYLSIIRQRDSDRHGYDASGITRVFMRGGNPRLGPAATVSPKFAGKGNFIAVGPTWETAKGERVSLAQLRSKADLKIIEQTPDRVVFDLISPVSSNAKVRQHVIITPKAVEITDTLEGEGLSNIGLQFPLLVTDGQDETIVQLHGNQLDMSLHDLQNRLTVTSPENATLTREDKRYVHVNGMAERVTAVTDRDSITYRLEAITQ